MVSITVLQKMQFQFSKEKPRCKNGRKR